MIPGLSGSLRYKRLDLSGTRYYIRRAVFTREHIVGFRVRCAEANGLGIERQVRTALELGIAVDLHLVFGQVIDGALSMSHSHYHWI